MNSFLFNILLLFAVYLLYKFEIFPTPQSILLKDNQESRMSVSKESQESHRNEPLGARNPEDILVDINGKKVPLSRINKPHNVVIPKRDEFPNIESKDQQNKEDLKEFGQANLGGEGTRQKIDPKDFPPVEPEAKEREAKLEAERAKNQ
ncbi:uncharacterized protein KGF55_001760 [Candida pseudojiufengensis]|uniref:uncharacterized protein n=1 Tax=Candida pseudojiufengensis TaxID=497109 RepID=UPI002225922C|nr:uncharacterized protein KGF55_001760 [Candida pseudojiufengensis]KAI5964691.1 hypothetical protein KGF55_001760 [Candida pseudojiufengensis]